MPSRMTAVPANVEEPSKPDDATHSAPQAEVAIELEAAPPASEPDHLAPSPASEFLAKVGLQSKMQTVQALNAQMALEHPHIEELFPTIEGDPALLKRFLQFANGGWFNTRIQIDSPYMAYTRFGTQGFYRIALAAFVSEGIGELTTRFRIWPHLQSVARTGEMLARQLAPKFVDDVFAVGLMHDAVAPAMQRELQDYLYFLECALNIDPLVTSLESECHGFNHAQAAAELAAALHFPAHVIEAIARHHADDIADVPAGDAKTTLALLLVTKRAIWVQRTGRRSAFETTTEKALLAEIASALNVSTARIQQAVMDLVDLLSLQNG